MRKEWSIEEVGALVADLKLLRPPTEIAGELGRDEEDVLEKMTELGLVQRALGKRRQSAKAKPRSSKSSAEF
jgi:hypothetical protein